MFEGSNNMYCSALVHRTIQNTQIPKALKYLYPLVLLLQETSAQVSIHYPFIRHLTPLSILPTTRRSSKLSNSCFKLVKTSLHKVKGCDHFSYRAIFKIGHLYDWPPFPQVFLVLLKPKWIFSNLTAFPKFVPKCCPGLPSFYQFP